MKHKQPDFQDGFTQEWGGEIENNCSGIYYTPCSLTYDLTESVLFRSYQVILNFLIRKFFEKGMIT